MKAILYITDKPNYNESRWGRTEKTFDLFIRKLSFIILELNVIPQVGWQLHPELFIHESLNKKELNIIDCYSYRITEIYLAKDHIEIFIKMS